MHHPIFDPRPEEQVPHSAIERVIALALEQAGATEHEPLLQETLRAFSRTLLRLVLEHRMLRVQSTAVWLETAAALPPHGKPVWMASGSEDRGTEGYCTHSDSGPVWRLPDGQAVTRSITHWRDLPHPPAGSRHPSAADDTLSLLEDLQASIDAAEHKPGQWRRASTEMGGIANFALSEQLVEQFLSATAEKCWAHFSFKRDSWLAVEAVNALPTLMRLARQAINQSA